MGSVTELVLIQNDGSGQLSVLPGQPLNIAANNAIDFGDLDGDGDADAVAIGNVSPLGGTRTILRNPSNAFSIDSQSPHPNTIAVELADLDADGFADLLWRENPVVSSTSVSFALGDGQFGFGPTIALPTASNPGLVVRSIRAADWNADGSMDVLYTFEDSFGESRIQTILQGPALSFQPGASGEIPQIQPIVAIVDVNGDGKLDVELTNGRTVEQVAGGGFDLVRLAGPTRYTTLAGVDADPELERVYLTHPAVVNVLDASCAGAGAGRFGHACTGLGGFAPKLSLTGCPNPGGNVVLDLERGPGGSVAVLLFSTAAAPQSFASNCAFELGGTILPLAPILPLGGIGAGAGAISFPTALAANLPPFTVAMQAFVADSSRAIGYTTSNGIELVVR